MLSMIYDTWYIAENGIKVDEKLRARIGLIIQYNNLTPNVRHEALKHLESDIVGA